MLTHDPRILSLLPAVGLCSCVVPSEAPTRAPELAAAAPGLIESFEREPLSEYEALIRSGRESLAVGHYEAALASFSLAAARYPDAGPLVDFDRIDAALGAGEIGEADRLLREARAIRDLAAPTHARLHSRTVRLRELENSHGIVGCDAEIDAQPRPLPRSEDALAAWSSLRAGLPAEHSIPIPTTEADARARLCERGCEVGEPSFVRIEGDNEATLGLLIPHADGGFSLVPALLHERTSSCDDQPLLAIERHDGLVRVRAFVDRLERADDWQLVELPEYDAPASAPSYAYANYAASSGYQGYAYTSSGYYNYGYHYGCGGYDDYDDESYASCQVRGHVERDLILDLDRGEIVLDIVRTGERFSALGRVDMTPAPTGPVVDVRACGVEQRLQLSYT